MTEFYFVLAGSLLGAIAGLLPGVGVMTSMLLVYPFLINAEILHLILFYMALAAMVQFTGTVPAIFLGVPGETNSAPAVIEGSKFTRHRRSDLAVGICALGSVLGSVIAVGIFFLLSDLLFSSFTTVVSNRFKVILFVGIFCLILIIYNNFNILVNLLLFSAGLFLALVGESSVTQEYRFTFGITDLEYGFSKVPVITGILVIPILFQNLNITTYTKNIVNVNFLGPMKLFYKNYMSSIRGSIIGFISGLVPGLTTTLATNLSYTIESWIHKNKPVNKIIACETANNSGQFSSLIPLLLFGIPITGSEILLYNLLVESGWSTNQFSRVGENLNLMINSVLPWFVFVNLLGLLISWPLAKYAMKIFCVPGHMILVLVLTILVAVNIFVGYTEFRIISYCTQFMLFAIIGYCLKNYNTTPVIFSFLLGSEIEGVFYREYLFYIN